MNTMVSQDQIIKVHNFLKKELNLDISFASDENMGMRRVKTGMPMFDYILGGGFPRGAITLLHGEESAGKTFVTQKAIAHAQQQGFVCGFVDVEHAYSQDWSEKIGIDNSKLLISTPLSAEEALDIAIGMCSSGMVDLVILDSLAALSPSGESSASMGDAQIGLQSRLIGKFLRNVCAKNHEAALVLINQHRVDLLGRAFHGQQPYSLPGGKSQRYFAKIRVELKRGPYLYDKGAQGKKGSIPNGFTIRAKTQKNKTHIPMLECDIPVYYTGEIDYLGEIFDLGCMYNIIKRSGPYYSFGENKVLGREGFKKDLQNEDFRVLVEDAIENYVANSSYLIGEDND